MAQHEEPSRAPDDGVLGTVSFGFVASSNTDHGMNLNDLGFVFDDGQPETGVGKRAFEQSITAMNQALVGYAQVLAEREEKPSELLTSADTDPAVLASSDQVHEALLGLKTGHLAYTGHPFLEGPLTRKARRDKGPGTYVETDWEPAALQRAGSVSTGPMARELGVSVALNHLLYSGDGRTVRLEAATVHSNGVMLGIECAQLRGERETADFWARRSGGTTAVELEAHDPLSGPDYTFEPLDLGAARFTQVARHRGELWMPGVLAAQELSCTLHVSYLPNIHGDETTLELGFDLDTAALREATTHIQRFDEES